MENPQSQQTVEINELLTICASQHCRTILSYFRDSPKDTVQLTDLIDHLEKKGHGNRKQVSIQLHHSALPRLAKIGYLDYDKRSDTIRYQGHLELEALAVSIANR